ncbi:hypothetical protein KJ554_03190 [bacterium]|nr:hypothetical protein [bacterium]
MNRFMTTVLLLAAAVLIAGCTEQQDDAAAWNETIAEKAASGDHAGHTGVVAASSGREGPAVPGGTGQPGGKVLETFDSGGYTYVRLETPGGELWAAGPVCEVAVGGEVALTGAMVMRNFKSSTLDRTFEEIWFASAIRPGGVAVSAGPDDEWKRAHDDLAAGGAGMDFTDLAVPAGGYTVAGLHAARDDLAGRRVKLRGKVVKYLGGIMGRNWLHLRDGTGDVATGDHDITVTTDGSARTGDTVLVEGVVALDKDFGSGYFYSVIVEEATVTSEEAL